MIKLYCTESNIALFEKIKQYAERKSIKTGEKFMNIGEIPYQIGIVRSGRFRHYVKDEEEREITIDFSFKDELIANIRNLVRSESSILAIEALVDCEIDYIEYEQLKELINTDNEIAKLAVNVLEQNLSKVSIQYERQLLGDATQKYIDLLDREPLLAKYIPLKYIASYLNITQQYLSRIRKQLSIEERL